MIKNFDSEGIIQFDHDEKYVKFSLNKEIYPLKAVYQAGYCLMDRAAVIFSNSSQDIIVELRPIDLKLDLNVLMKEFNDEVLNYLSYFTFSEKNEKYRDIILNSIISNNVTSRPSAQDEIEDIENIFEEWKEEDNNDLVDQEKI